MAVQERRLPSAEGKAETPGAEEVISCINSVCSLPKLDRINRLRTKKLTVSSCSGHLGLFEELALKLGQLEGYQELNFECPPYRSS